MDQELQYFEQQSLLEASKENREPSTWRWGSRKTKILFNILLITAILVANSILNQRAMQTNLLTKEEYSKIAKLVKHKIIQTQINKFKAAGITPADLMNDSSATPSSDRKIHAKSVQLETKTERTKTEKVEKRDAKEGADAASAKPKDHTAKPTTTKNPKPLPKPKPFDIKGASLYFSFIPVSKPKSDLMVFGFSLFKLLGLGDIPLPLIFQKGTKLELKLGTDGVNDQKYIADRKELFPNFIIPPGQAEKLPTKEFSGAKVVLTLHDGTKSEAKITVNLEADAFKMDFIGDKKEKTYMDLYVMELQDNKIKSVENLPIGWFVRDFWGQFGGEADQWVQQILKDLEKTDAKGTGDQNFDQMNWVDLEKFIAGMK